jgi:hypothetical protein
MRFYAYKGRVPLGKESLGTSGKMLFQLKTVDGAIRRTLRYFGPDASLYTYTNFYKDSTFKKVY